ncbi:hypothetical protein GEMRC1_011351 [Eukaryota sp. GEM-RC1]
MFDFEGNALARISSKKADFYLARNIARPVKVIHTLELKAIQLLIKPLGHDTLDTHGLYVIGPQEEICVVCGCTDNITHHHLVPFCYRKFFPHASKVNQSFDVVLLCSHCHESYEQVADLEKDSIADEFQCPLFRTDDPRVSYIRSVRTAALALLETKCDDSHCSKERIDPAL